MQQVAVEKSQIPQTESAVETHLLEVSKHTPVIEHRGKDSLGSREGTQYAEIQSLMED